MYQKARIDSLKKDGYGDILGNIDGKCFIDYGNDTLTLVSSAQSKPMVKKKPFWVFYTSKT